MKPRRLFGLAVVAALLALVGTAIAERLDTFYEFGFSRTLSFISTRVDSIPAGATFSTHWIPISGASQVNFFIRATNADSDSVVSVVLAAVDTVLGTTAIIDTLGTDPGMLGSGVGVYSSYKGTGGTSWGPNLAKTITIVPYRNSVVAMPYIPMRWARLIVTAPLAGTVAVNSWNTVKANSMHGVRIWAEVRRDHEQTGSSPTYPFSGVASP
jgi:hypothetical protein